jgi:hypothetical protein
MNVVCIAGMHRSGTSMIAGVLQECGLHLGRSEDLMGPAPDNPAGFFENQLIVGLNDRLLAQARGSWDSPPRNPNWELAEFASLRTQAGEVVASIGVREPWGWKDPRTSLTLGFWLSVVPELRVVVAVRNPLEVATSLRLRNGMEIARGLSLWHAYNASLMVATQPHERLVSSFDRYFGDLGSEIRRLADFAGLQPAREAADRARASVASGLRHNQFEVGDLVRVGAPDEVLDLYAQLKSEAEHRVVRADR